MKNSKPCLLPLVAAAFLVSATQAYSQDTVWTQPYSGNMIYGPFSAKSGDLPNCPECECEICQPGGCKGVFGRFWGGVCDRIQRGRREYYFNKQIYHTGYTRPVLPPYCDPGFGYYETAWRQPGSPVFCDPIPYGPAVQSELPLEPPFSAAPAPAPAPVLNDSLEETKPNPMNNRIDGKDAENAQSSAFNAYGGQMGYEKPRFEMNLPETGGDDWKPTSSNSRRQTSKYGLFQQYSR